MRDKIDILPAIALRGATVMPNMVIHFDISRDRSVKAVEEAMVREQKIFLVTQRDPSVEEPTLEALYQMGTVATIKQVVKLPKKVLRILVEGMEKAEIIGKEENEDFLEFEVAVFDEKEELLNDELEKEAMLRNLKELFQNYCKDNPKISRELSNQFMDITQIKKLVNQIGIHMPLDYEERQRLLEEIGVMEQYEFLCVTLTNEIEILRIKQEIQGKVKEQIDKGQREYILREQLKVIRRELGDDTTLTDMDQFNKKLTSLKASKEVRDKIKEEINRYKMLGNNTAESAVVRGYLETLLALPWDKVTRDNKDLRRAKEILEADHYGLEKVKERILEFLAVRTLRKKGSGPIICLAGPPGTGKTSIARSIAKALNKEYVRISLGGVKDEAEIRGHRRTYVGAMPGRIVAGLKQAKVKNPLILLDEVDKVSGDHRGDTASALLEVLDGEQNHKFADHYVELPVDLSEVLFLATANDLQTIPKPLLDRMEIIEVTSYTENEKLHIAIEHLIPKQLESHGLKTKQLTIEEGALWNIISGYTKESGVRNLERKIGEICRKATRKIVEEKVEVIRVTKENLEEYLGPVRYTYIQANLVDEVGIVRGLAWTSVGGDTLQIEVNVMPGKGEFLLTGQLGDVMKESAQAGISYIRSVSNEYAISEDYFKKHDIHIHIPEGAVPKDGPSAGITMATAMVSAITGIPVKAEVAMTGEITLRGRVLSIGGLKEKLLAAKKAGIKKVLVPKKNEPDVIEISEEIKEGLQICFMEHMSEVLEQALAK